MSFFLAFGLAGLFFWVCIACLFLFDTKKDDTTFSILGFSIFMIFLSGAWSLGFALAMLF